LGRRIRSVANAFPRRLKCNVCGWQGRAFLSDGWHDNSACPRCDSLVRHRLLLAALHQAEGGFSLDAVFRGKRVLHFAPEASLVRHFRPLASTYATADLFAPGCDLRLDLAHMASVGDAAYDVVIACDVLEHVLDDRKALGEIRRVLAARGVAVLMVPQKDALAKTFEDRSVTTPEQRERAYGISNHYRIYGTDFSATLAEHGFSVQMIDHLAFAPAVVRHHVLFPQTPSPHPLATNHRRVYLAQRP